MLKKVVRTLVPIQLRFAVKSSILWEIPIFLNELRFIQKPFYGNSLEDKVLFDLLPGKSGTYIDIGSGRPVKGSNTFFFYRRGWRGILIDPLTTNKRLSRILRRKDHFIQGVVSNSSEKSLDFYEFLPYGNSTTVQELAEKQSSTRGFYLVRQKRIKNINTKDLPNLSRERVILLSIDTEGRDLEIITSLDFERIRPKVIVLEAWTSKVQKEIEDFLARKGYRFLSRCGDSVIFEFKND